MIVLEGRRLQDTLRSLLRGVVERVLCIGHAQRHVLHAVAVLEGVLGDGRPRAHRAGEHVAGVVLFDDVAGAIPDRRLGAAVRGDVEPERLRVVEGRLLGVADVELHVVDAEQRHQIFATLLVGVPELLRHVRLPSASPTECSP